MRTLIPFFTVQPEHVQLALLAMIRLSGLLMLAPPFDSRMIPIPVRTGVAFSLVFLVWSDLSRTAPPLAVDVLSLGGLAASELAVGVTLGFAGRLLVAAASYAAELISVQMGFGLASILNPLQGAQSTVLAMLFDMTVLSLFLALDAHHLLIGAVVESFRVAPPGAVALSASTLGILLPLGGRIFGLGLALVAPAVGILFIGNLVMVLAARAVPQLNLMAVGFPITGLLGLVVLFANVDLFGGLIGSEIRNLETLLITVLRSFAHGG